MGNARFTHPVLNLPIPVPKPILTGNLKTGSEKGVFLS